MNPSKTLIFIVFFIGFVEQNWAQKNIENKKDSIFDQCENSLKTSFKNYTENYKSNDSLFDKIIDFKQSRNKNIKSKIVSKFKSTDIGGTISTFYKYGLLSEYTDTSSLNPLEVYGMNGEIRLNTFDIPFKVNFNYASYQNPIGVNNYLRFSYDFDYYKNKKIKIKETDFTDQLDKQVNTNIKIQDEMLGQISYTEILLQLLNKEIEKETSKIQLVQNSYQIKCEYSSVRNVDAEYCDSLKNDLEIKKSRLEKLKSKSDSINYYYQQLIILYDDYKDASSALSKGSEEIKNKRNHIDPASYSGKLNGFMSSFTKFDLGLTYPQTTSLSTNSVPMKGISFEREKNNWYLSFASGFLLNNLFVTNDLVQNNLKNKLNPFNQFDFQEIKGNPFLTSLKSGYGLKNKTHLYVGFNYMTKNPEFIPNKIPVLSLELDGKFAPEKIKEISLELTAGKTSLYDSTIHPNYRFSDCLGSTFNLKNKTGFGLVKIDYTPQKLKSTFSISLRHLASEAETKVFGVLQPDNRRIEFKSKHKILSKTQLGFTWRLEQNNLDNKRDSTIQLLVYGSQLNGTLFHQINYYFAANIVDQHSILLSNQTRRNLNQNYLINTGINYQFQLEKTQHLISVNYSDLNFKIGDSIQQLKNVYLQLTNQFKTFKNNFSVGYFLEKTIQNKEAYVITDDINFNCYKLSITLGVKYSKSEINKNDFGGKFVLKYPLIKNLSISVLGEKLVYGNYYMNFNPILFQRFPYVCSGIITYTF